MKEVILKTPVILGIKEDGTTNETNKIILREPTAGDLRGLSFKKLGEIDIGTVSTLLSRITQPQIAVSSISLMSLKDFSYISEKMFDLINGEDEEGEQGKKIEPTLTE